MEFLTLKDLASRTHDEGISVVAETLSQSNPIIQDMPMVECNDKTGYKSTIRTGLPAVAWRKLNYGVKQSKSKTQQVRDTCGMLEAYSYIDMDLLRLAKDQAEFLKTENDAYLEKMSQEWSSTIFFGDTAKTPEKFLGLSARYATLSGSSPSVKNVISAGSEKPTGNRSIWLIGWGPDKVHAIYPEGSQGGLMHDNQGEDRVKDTDGNDFQAYVNHFKLNTGLCVRDWRYVVRICNIDLDSIQGSDLLKLMTKAKRRIPNLTSCKPVWYMDRDVATVLENAIMDKNNVQLSLREAQDGLQELMACRIPVHECDALEADEDLVK